MFKRIINLKDLKTSAFLFGPRMTGKTTILKTLGATSYFDLLDSETELEYKTNPKSFWQQISALPKNSFIIVDEIQKVPALLNYVQMGIDELHHNFLLSGSSSRKLKRGGANLLGGRAIDLKLHPLIYKEIGEFFSIDSALQYGTLPKICSLLQENNLNLAKQHLKSYIGTYLKEEIQAEALTRNVGAFNRFLNIAVQSNAHVIEFTNISRECSVPKSTVKEYYQILEDTLIGFFLWPYDSSERKKARPKFYFFDCGVIRAVQNRLNDPPIPLELGYLFETWFINELVRINDYYAKGHQFSFWRYNEHEIDVIISAGHGPFLAIECKSGRTEIKPSTINHLYKSFPNIPILVVSLNESKPKKIGNNIDLLPWKMALENYMTMK